MNHIFACIVILLHHTMVLAKEESKDGGIVDMVKGLYDYLPPQAKFASGVFVGFVTSRIALKAIVVGFKVAGVTFIA